MLFGCSLFCGLMTFPSSRTCRTLSPTVAECRDDYQRFGNSVPEPAICYWRQHHFAGLIFTSEAYEQQCGGFP